MSALVGTVILDDDLYWVTQFQDVGMSAKKTTLSGAIVVSRMKFSSITGSTDQEHTFEFFWATGKQVAQMRSLFLDLTAITIIPCIELGPSLLGCVPIADGFKASPVVSKDFMSHARIKGTPLDLYNGELRLVVPASALDEVFASWT
jgi:hypothetical protein